MADESFTVSLRMWHPSVSAEEIVGVFGFSPEVSQRQIGTAIKTQTSDRDSHRRQIGTAIKTQTSDRNSH